MGCKPGTAKQYNIKNQTLRGMSEMYVGILLL